LLALGYVLTAYAARPVKHRISLPTDWSHQHLIFSRPASPEAERVLLNDPRYLQQMYRRSQALRPLRLADGSLVSAKDIAVRAAQGKKKQNQGLWSVDIGDLGTDESPGAGNYPAKFSFDNEEANCATDYVVYSTGLPGGVTQADIVAFNNIYPGCSGTVPSAYWAYNTGGSLLTSPALSEDGTQVAFAQSSSGTGELVLLKWAADATALHPPITIPATPATYRTCTAPCMVIFLLEDNGTFADDTTSSVFIDYGGDIAWVGDSLGFLHKFTGVFKGSPEEDAPPTVPTSPFPVQVRPAHPGTPVTSPVYDSKSKLVFLADGAGSDGDYGSLFSVNPSTGATTIATSVDHGVGIVESPVVDSASQEVYVFSSSFNGLGGLHSNDCTTPPCAGVSQFKTTFIGGDTGLQVTTGDSSATPNPLYIGAFDSSYLDSRTNPSGPTGNMYVCGNTGGPPTLYQVPFAAGTFATFAASAVTRLAIPSSTAPCSPVTDFINPNLAGGSEEHLYLSLPSGGRESACNTLGCIMSFVDTPWQKSTAYVVGQEILDTNLQIETVVTAGTSSAAAPLWPGTDGIQTTDNAVTWIDQGFLSAADIPPRGASQAYGLHLRTVDSNGNFEIVTTAGTTGAGAITWNTVIGQTTTDGTVTWTNAGPDLRGGLQIPGGTTGVIIDNAVIAPVPGSQVYFGTLANQTTCITSGGTGTCAIQASQADLQ
jgi:hypothetical protein